MDEPIPGKVPPKVEMPPVIPVAPVDPTQSPQPPRSNSSKPIIAVVVGLLLLGGVGVAAYQYGGGGYGNDEDLAILDDEDFDNLDDEELDDADNITDENTSPSPTTTQTVAANCELPVVDVPELAISYGVPKGWTVERDGNTLAIMEDERNLTAAFIYTAKLEQDLSAQQFLNEFTDVFKVTIEDAGGAFEADAQSADGSVARRTVRAQVAEGHLTGVFATEKASGFVTFKAYWAPTAELATKEAVLKKVTSCFARQTVLNDTILAAAKSAQASSSGSGQAAVGSNPWGSLVSQSKGSFTFQAPSSWTAQANSGGSTTSLVLDAPGLDASIAFISDLGRYGAADPTEFAQTTLGVVGFQASLGSAQSLEGGVSAYDFSGTFQGKSVKGVIAVKIQPYQTFFAHSVGIQVANTDKWQQYAPTLNAIQTSIRLTSAGQALASLPSMPNLDTDTVFGGSGTGSSFTSGSRYQDEVSDRSNQKWADAMRGYEEVESPTTGQKYDAPLNSWNPSGPDGAGYYRGLPNGGLEKLTQTTP